MDAFGIWRGTARKGCEVLVTVVGVFTLIMDLVACTMVPMSNSLIWCGLTVKFLRLDRMDIIVINRQGFPSGVPTI